jgi:hypothetical protein
VCGFAELLGGLNVNELAGTGPHPIACVKLILQHANSVFRVPAGTNRRAPPPFLPPSLPFFFDDGVSGDRRSKAKLNPVLAMVDEHGDTALHSALKAPCFVSDAEDGETQQQLTKLRSPDSEVPAYETNVPVTLLGRGGLAISKLLLEFGARPGTSVALVPSRLFCDSVRLARLAERRRDERSAPRLAQCGPHSTLPGPESLVPGHTLRSLTWSQTLITAGEGKLGIDDQDTAGLTALMHAAQEGNAVGPPLPLLTRRAA